MTAAINPPLPLGAKLASGVPSRMATGTIIAPPKFTHDYGLIAKLRRSRTGYMLVLREAALPVSDERSAPVDLCEGPKSRGSAQHSKCATASVRLIFYGLEGGEIFCGSRGILSHVRRQRSV